MAEKEREVDGFERYLGVVKKKHNIDWIWVNIDR